MPVTESPAGIVRVQHAQPFFGLVPPRPSVLLEPVEHLHFFMRRRQVGHRGFFDIFVLRQSVLFCRSPQRSSATSVKIEQNRFLAAKMKRTT